MGQSQSQQAIQPEHQGEIVTPVSSTRDEKGSGTDTAMGGQETAREGVDDSMERTAGEHAASSTVTGPSAPPPAAASSSTTETFKVPALPASSTTASGPTTLSSITSPSATMRTLPADIEHILSLGANQPDEAERAAAAAEGRGRQELEQAVRGLKENALKADGEVRMESEEEQRRREELLEVEAEMREKGVKREEEANEEDVDVTVQSTDGGEVKVKKEDRMADDSDSSDSSDSSESDSDSDTSESDSTTAGPQGGRRNRRNRQRAASVASDIDDDESGVVSSKTAPKTEHEVVEPDVAPPTVQKLDENVELAKFGKVESVIENVVVVKADTGGDWRVLDEGTVVCWEDRTVVGTIFETFGSVQQPFYSIRFPSSAPPDRSIFTISRPVFYSPNLASFVFTRDLRHIKGSDASNIWDEEVAAHEIEFSDDEEEAEHRKRIKADLPPRQPPTDYYAQPQQQAQPYAFGTAGDASPGALNFGAAMQWPYAPAWPAMGGAYGYGTVPAAAGFYGGAGAAGAYQAPYGGGGASAGYSPHQPHTGNGDAYQRQGASGANGGYGAGQYQGQRSGQGGYGQGQGQGGQSSTGWYAGAGGGGGGW
ncbi:snoRNP assembly factor Naf1 [Rhodotorula toruloides]|uniref:H/ACA ribonucleoprotein complex non-core subunit NAF1 n=1 Tax=Rhodotorula toruloides TaxID=5286 RepID=A0A511K9N1_RHOTO|nr:snoRNP assembly factor Naf1 [Rhodotorula toruloides]